ncbi:Y phosphatase-domain-containing protein [Teratosphaeria destructans]|uniref:Y phosphatase-domain-containing protein n=1 Tax=Teratosphaeria destructans TaxID=418781 RepID=A0A9W7SQM0_9PEZI|nr:Y phosphatase-domain-containing protein [Teratosphaeria destructans]
MLRLWDIFRTAMLDAQSFPGVDGDVVDGLLKTRFSTAWLSIAGFCTSASMAKAPPPTPNPTPRIIHCSAGVGRSGTFIALDYLLSLLHAGDLDHIPADRDPVAETVDRLRQQRMMMVQGEGQFYFVYEVLREQFLVHRLGVAPEALGLEGTDDAGAGASVED